ncbi:MAG: hypothetical protein AB8H03_07390 [Saprospiraceae bacterium]
MPKSKNKILEIIASGETKKAVEATLEYAKWSNDNMTLNGVTNLSNSMNSLIVQQRQNTISYEEYARLHSKINVSLISWINNLPVDPLPEKIEKRLEAKTFKWNIFYWLVGIKLVVLLWTLQLWQTGGFRNDEALTTFSALLPAFITYVSLMLKDIFSKNDSPLDQAKRYVSSKKISMARILFVMYMVLQCWVVYMKVIGYISFPQMNLMIAGIESVLGGFIGIVVLSFFRKDV